MDPALRALLTQYVAVSTLASVDSNQKATYNTATQVAAHVTRKERTWIGANGRTYTTGHVVLTGDQIVLTSRIWIPPDGDTLPPSSAKALIPQVSEPVYSATPAPAGTSSIAYWRTLA